MRRHAHDIGRAGFEDPVERRHSGRRIVDDEFHSRCHRLRDGDGGYVVRERAEAQKDRVLVVLPVLDHRAGVGEQGVVGMHDTLRRPGRARGKGEIGDLVGVAVERRREPRGIGRRKRRGLGRSVAQGAQMAQVRQFGGSGEDVGAVRVGAMAGLREQSGGTGAGQQFDDLGDGVVAVQ